MGRDAMPDEPHEDVLIVRIIRSWRSYNKRLGVLGFGAMLGWATVACFGMLFIFLGLNTDGQLSPSHDHEHPCRVLAAWTLCLPIMTVSRLAPESWLPSWLPTWLPLVFVIAFNFLVLYLVWGPVVVMLSPQRPSVEEIVCPRCGVKNANTRRYCVVCGRPLA